MLRTILLVGLLAATIGCAQNDSTHVSENRIDAVGIDRSHADPAVQQLLQRADAYYALYVESGSAGYWREHDAAVDGALQRLMHLWIQEGAEADLEPVDQEASGSDPRWSMPTDVYEDGMPLVVPMGRA